MSIVKKSLSKLSSAEALKGLTLILIHIFVTFNYTLLKTLKEPLVTSLKRLRWSLFLPYVKTWAVLPAAIFAAILFTRLCSRFGFRRAFNVFLGCFTVYFTLFVLFFTLTEKFCLLGMLLLLKSVLQFWLLFFSCSLS